MTVGQRPVTAEELLQTPDDGPRRELVRGEVRTMSCWRAQFRASPAGGFMALSWRQMFRWGRSAPLLLSRLVPVPIL